MDSKLREFVSDVEGSEIGRGVTPFFPHPDSSYSATFDGRWYQFRAATSELDQLVAAMERKETFIEWSAYAYAGGTLVDVGR
jgi:hypothetical protein